MSTGSSYFLSKKNPIFSQLSEFETENENDHSFLTIVSVQKENNFSILPDMTPNHL